MPTSKEGTHSFVPADDRGQQEDFPECSSSRMEGLENNLASMKEELRDIRAILKTMGEQQSAMSDQIKDLLALASSPSSSPLSV